MDIEKLIDDYRKAADKWEKRHPVTDTFDLRVQDALREAATALSTLQAENEKLRSEIVDLETTHRTEMCESGYDCVELGKVRTELKRERDHRRYAEQNADNFLKDCKTLTYELTHTKHALAEMWFAYVNKDGEIPHTYEEEAVELAQEILGPWGECMPKYLRRGPHKED